MRAAGSLAASGGACQPNRSSRTPLRPVTAAQATRRAGNGRLSLAASISAPFGVMLQHWRRLAFAIGRNPGLEEA
jgi:hypothetical protein